MTIGIRKRKRLLEAVKPFEQAAHIIELARKPANDEPLRELIPGLWPTYGQLHELLSAIYSVTERPKKDG